MVLKTVMASSAVLCTSRVSMSTYSSTHYNWQIMYMERACQLLYFIYWKVLIVVPARENQNRYRPKLEIDRDQKQCSILAIMQSAHAQCCTDGSGWSQDTKLELRVPIFCFSSLTKTSPATAVSSHTSKTALDLSDFQIITAFYRRYQRPIH